MKLLLSRNRHLFQRIGFTSITLMAFATVTPIVATVIYILIKGGPAISLEFLTGFPHDGMREGGILPAIIGTLYLTLGTAVFSVPLGIAAAIYLSEYAADTPLTRTIRIAIINLAGIPSVVYGLFGLGGELAWPYRLSGVPRSKLHRASTAVQTDSHPVREDGQTRFLGLPTSIK